MCFDDEEYRESEDLEQRIKGSADAIRKIRAGMNESYYVSALHRLTQDRIKHVRLAAEKVLEESGYRTRKEDIPFCDKCGLNMIYTQTRSEFGYEKDFYGCPICSDYVKVGEEESGGGILSLKMIPETIDLMDGIYLEWDKNEWVLWERNEAGSHYSLKDLGGYLYSKILDEHRNEIIEEISKTFHLPMDGRLEKMLKIPPKSNHNNP